ncbi:branched-chain amino acid ABC transporter substrate-binding protein [Kutzneria sp. CA-103260]|uniref:branched-chain amino acid ABC transporter substrate-binding protein n=1 Tax=Kutzneria sp. CA-103260 TaxID=2802641 RepID=UPI001BF16E68|nr:branched-chain amino acid ABC transporter substrate-binding protein [Kutzneria sp. CA-103260]QUQ67477.1 branched-chain amino acid ABC transporter substrate-binding protein [Kutzneria sp. CA-103260]
MRNRTVKAAVVVMAGALALAACGTNKTESGGAASCDVSKGTLVIGTISPLSGNLSAVGLGIEHSADLAVAQANEKCTVKGYKLSLDGEDDQATPQTGAQAATKMSSDSNVVGVVGTLNSSVAQTVQPILSGKKIPMVSPANTNPSLTQGKDPANEKRQFDNYFRVCTTDTFQGPYAADYLVKTAGKKKIAIIQDGKTYGLGLSQAVADRVTKDGGQVVDKEQVGENDTDFSGVLTKVKATSPDAIFYGGEYPAAGPLSKQAAGLGLNVPVMGGDGIFDPKFIALGGKEGDLATSVGAPADQLQSAAQFIKDYAAKSYKEPYASYGAFAYDAANVIIASLAKTLGDSGTWSDTQRDALIKNIQSYSGTGATGPISFDQYGDSTNKVLTVYQVSSGDWKPVKSGSAES